MSNNPRVGGKALTGAGVSHLDPLGQGIYSEQQQEDGQGHQGGPGSLHKGEAGRRRPTRAAQSSLLAHGGHRAIGTGSMRRC